MTAYTAPPPHRSALPVRPTARGKVIPRSRNRIGAAASMLGLALALLSLYLPWLATDSAPGGSLTAMEITDTIDVRSIATVLFIGLVWFVGPRVQFLVDDEGITIASKAPPRTWAARSRKAWARRPATRR